MEERKILIVDDEPDIREILELLLKSNGYKVFSAADGERALELATEKDDLDLIILDIMMPVEDGISVLKKVR
jgi:CheY-like chemotaxis protein